MQPSKSTKRLLGRAVAPVGAAAIVVLAAVFAGPGWFEQLVRWSQPTARAVPVREPVSSGPIGAPITVTPMRPVGNDSSVSLVPLPLILVRVQPGRNSRDGFAQIGVDARSPQTYGAGAVLANGARLAEIYAHYVVLERDSHSARLYLQGEAQPESASVGDLLTVGGGAAPATAGPMSEDRLTDYVRSAPVFVGEQLHGYALYAGRIAEPFAQLGLQPGDVLTRINGSGVSNPVDSLAALRTLVDGADLTVMIEREGSPQTLSLDGAILAHAIPAARSPATPLTPPESPLQGFFKIDPPPLTRKPGL